MTLKCLQDWGGATSKAIMNKRFVSNSSSTYIWQKRIIKDIWWNITNYGTYFTNLTRSPSLHSQLSATYALTVNCICYALEFIATLSSDDLSSCAHNCNLINMTDRQTDRRAGRHKQVKKKLLALKWREQKFLTSAFKLDEACLSTQAIRQVAQSKRVWLKATHGRH